MKKSLVFFLLMLSSISFGGMTQPTVTVVYSDFKPMTFDVDGNPSGFDIDLWEAIALDAGIQFKYKKTTFQEIVPSLASREADVGLAGITMTAEREKYIDFSHSYFQSGLRLLTTVSTDVDLMSSTAHILANKKMIKAFLYFFLFILICGHILYWAERGSNEAISDHYFPGIFESFWCVFATMTTVGYGDIAPKKWLGRSITMVIGISGITFFGWFIAVFASSLDNLDSQQTAKIKKATELKGYTIATKAKTTSVDVITSSGGKLVTSENIAESYAKLAFKEVDGVLFDSPSILHRLNTDNTNQLMIVGDLINKQSYGIALQPGSPLREKINRSLLKLQSNGTYDQIYSKWFNRHE